jgi:hypothetical protein
MLQLADPQNPKLSDADARTRASLLAESMPPF